MSDNKKYYYLKLKDNFYNNEDIKLLESMKNGYEYSSLYLKLCLLSLKGEGRLLYKNRIPYRPEMISTITGHSLEVVNYAIPIFQEIGLMNILDNGTIFIDDMQTLIGSSSTEGERKAKYRQKIKYEQEKTDICPVIRPPEKEMKKEKEIKETPELKAFRIHYDSFKPKTALKYKQPKDNNLLFLLNNNSFEEIQNRLDYYFKYIQTDKHNVNHFVSCFEGCTDKKKVIENEPDYIRAERERNK